jgi:prenyltransferase beta subunit
MQTAPDQFRMNEGADSTIFTTCFALFIFDLFGEVNVWSLRERDTWIEYINLFQDKDTGYYTSSNFDGKINAKPIQQLTCFCLSALDILDSSPNYKLSFLKQWSRVEDIYDYLKDIGCYIGKPRTGNMAMFLAILLTCNYEKFNEESALAKLDSWFRWHERTQNESTGFWGNHIRNKYYAGFQNAFHQLLIYNYWNRPIPYYNRIVDIVLSLQDEDGHFAPFPGGGGCWDYDAADILIHCGYKREYRRQEIAYGLTKLFFAILRSQNEDGGFCETRRRPTSIKKALSSNNVRFIYTGHNPYLWYYRLRASLNAARPGKRIIKTHWTRKGREWGQSNLWDTWFRCLTLAEIAESIEFDNPLKHLNWNFHKCIGLGFFRT